MKYIFSVKDPNQQLLSVELLTSIKEGEHLLRIPTWRPGRYELANFAQYIYTPKATLAGDDLDIIKVSSHEWKILAPKTGELSVRYDFFANQMNAGGSWINDKTFYVNPINCCISVKSQEDSPITVEINSHIDSDIACGMNSPEKHVLQAKNYLELIDCPILMADDLCSIVYTVESILFTIWYSGNLEKDIETIVKDFAKFTQHQIRLFGGFPQEDYHFIFLFLPYRHYHGVEHRNSTVITLGKNEKDKDPIGLWYNELLGISSHELFHTWNVCKIRDSKMVPYDIWKPVHFETGCFLEGFTTYYGDLELVRSGVFSADEYLAEINKLLLRHQECQGRSSTSLRDSSIDLWNDGYKLGVPNRKVSIYNEGALAALILDLNLRLKSGSTISLDDVIVKLNEHFDYETGYSWESALEFIGEIDSEAAHNYIDLINGPCDYMAHLLDLLPKFGLEVNPMAHPTKITRLFGVFVTPTGIVKSFADTSEMTTKLLIGDRVQFDNEENFLEITRNGQTFEVTPIPLSNEIKIWQVTLSTENLTNRENWIGC